ncbi:MAG: DUF2099 family protein [Candidatus Omnitrophica bacterium]|nr:DUF2099 family protein [Candidatus Omnitrophota bacterium]
MTDSHQKEVHVLKYFSSFISISGGKVINVTEPALAFCPLAAHFYKEFKGAEGYTKKTMKDVIKKAVESKIDTYGFFTDRRQLVSEGIAVPYGASEMLMCALRKGLIEAAVVVCEGAGTVIVNTPEIVQGIGGRMNSLLLTSPIKGIIKKLKQAGCRIVFDNALIDQVYGVREAIKAGYRNIAVTISGHAALSLKALRVLEKEKGARIIVLVVCTTAATQEQIAAIRTYADLVWSCASADIRHMIGPMALLQLSTQIPVFVLTREGINFVAAYSNNPGCFRRLGRTKQYLISNQNGGTHLIMGKTGAFLKEARLPAFARRIPHF